MDRRIVGFHRDDAAHWVARLECGHDQHVRHDPPLVSRPWVTTEEGRRERLGQRLACGKCEEGAASDAPCYAEGMTKETDEATHTCGWPECTERPTVLVRYRALEEGDEVEMGLRFRPKLDGGSVSMCDPHAEALRDGVNPGRIVSEEPLS